MNAAVGHGPAAIQVARYGIDDYLTTLRKQHSSRQLDYLDRYVRGLKASSIVTEPFYFDRDYLAEFSAFYGSSSAGYINACRRLHFFTGDPPVTAESFRALLDSRPGSTVRSTFQDCYLGFSVLRPLPNASLGRTVLRWWSPDGKVVAPSRDYSVHLGGVPLTVRGLAWQQQDTGTAACATVSIWSMLHSAAFDERHAVPTTVSITAAAHDRMPGSFQLSPSDGLAHAQMRDAIQKHGFSPVSIIPDRSVVYGGVRIDAFSPERFKSLCGAYIGSGYTVLVLAQFLTPPARHSVCAVAFDPGHPFLHDGLALEDAGIEHLYLHDDNIGPAARFAVTESPATDISSSANPTRIVVLKRKPPSSAATFGPEPPYPDMVPIGLLVAVNPEIRTSGDRMWKLATQVAREYTKTVAQGGGGTLPPVVVGLRFSRLPAYLGTRLEALLGSQLGRVRRELLENVPPMSLFLGLVRIGVFYQGAIHPQIEILYDTTDNVRTNRAFAHLVLDASAAPYVAQLAKTMRLGVSIDAYSH